MEEKRQRQDKVKTLNQNIVPKEIFTTMRYHGSGLSLQQTCSACPPLRQRLQSDSLELEEVPLLERHLLRLQEAVAEMKIAYPAEWSACKVALIDSLRRSLEEDITRDISANKSLNRRVRFSIDRLGAVQITSFEMSGTTSSKEHPLRVRLDRRVDDMLEAPECLYRVKTGYREMYDMARDRVNATLGVIQSSSRDLAECFDVIMTQKHQGKRYMTESSIANILLHIHETDEILTPSCHSSALLNGLFRQELLHRQLIKEADLEVNQVCQMLEQGNATLYLCNALRGVIPVTLVS